MTRGTEHPSSLAPEAALDRLGRVRLADHSIDSLLDEVVVLVQRSVPGDVAASVTLVRDGRPFTAAFGADSARQLDEAQYGRGDGPCLAAARDGQVVEIADTSGDDRWPDYLPLVAERGFRSVLSLPFPLHEQVTGGLNMYMRAVDPLDEGTRLFAERFAAYAAVAAGNMLAYEQARHQAEHLHRALESRAVIDQAKGVLMERFRLTADQAFQTLVRLSNDTNTRLRVICERVVHSGEVPGTPGP